MQIPFFPLAVALFMATENGLQNSRLTKKGDLRALTSYMWQKAAFTFCLAIGFRVNGSYSEGNTQVRNAFFIKTLFLFARRRKVFLILREGMAEKVLCYSIKEGSGVWRYEICEYCLRGSVLFRVRGFFIVKGFI
ncbi:hypothetical protein CEXT_740681 [Caerostris extrusa]|uniref:Secreted protein n=1 Tax=Caerostris extrusa TaxID=172846 RepID=A0AAV4V7J6_CAEEX|nr:hypothetical protein CEXT_740681 [Caerostris extrusa]